MVWYCTLSKVILTLNLYSAWRGYKTNNVYALQGFVDKTRRTKVEHKASGMCGQGYVRADQHTDKVKCPLH